MTSNQTTRPSAAAAPLEYDPASETFHARYEPTGDPAPSAAIIDALATIEDRDPWDSPTALYDHVDPDALDALFRPLADGTPRPKGRVEFAFDTYYICVHSSGRIVIRSHRP